MLGFFLLPAGAELAIAEKRQLLTKLDCFFIFSSPLLFFNSEKSILFFLLFITLISKSSSTCIIRSCCHLLKKILDLAMGSR
jgi:hypothetical protein